MFSSWTKEEKQRKDRKAQYQIHLHLSNQILKDVLKEKTTIVLWLKLEKLYMKKILRSKLHLKQRLYLHGMAEGTSLEEHLVTFKEIVADMETLEVIYEEEDLRLILLCSLLVSYESFRDTILYSLDTLTLNEVYEARFSNEKIKQLIVELEAHGDSLLVLSMP